MLTFILFNKKSLNSKIPTKKKKDHKDKFPNQIKVKSQIVVGSEICLFVCKIRITRKKRFQITINLSPPPPPPPPPTRFIILGNLTVSIASFFSLTFHTTTKKVCLFSSLSLFLPLFNDFFLCHTEKK